MLKVEDLICIEKNRLKYRFGEKERCGIPEGIYEIVDGDFTPRRGSGPLYYLLQVGSPHSELLAVDWKSLQYNVKWRKL